MFRCRGASSERLVGFDVAVGENPLDLIEVHCEKWLKTKTRQQELIANASCAASSGRPSLFPIVFARDDGFLLFATFSTDQQTATSEKI